MQLRPYQQETIEALFGWWGSHPSPDSVPILSLPTGAGKSLIVAAATEHAFASWPDHHPRTLVIVPSKELAEQNADKLQQVLPPNLKLGYYSASVGKKQPRADVIVATIGTVAKAAHLLGNIKLVLIDECHLVSPDGPGQYRQFLRDLAKYCRFRVAGLTATPFRGNGVWLTDGRDPLFTGIAHEVPMRLLLDEKFLSPLVRPADVMHTSIDTEGIATTGGDFNVGQLSARVEKYLKSAATETVALASGRNKWIAFCPNVKTAEAFAALLCAHGAHAEVVTGDTPKEVRKNRIARFKAGHIRCLVTVLALATGFDVPDVDCVIWLRPTKSPVLYVQGAGRGLRIFDGKVDCLWLDFTDTTERLGPIDTIRGRAKGKARNAEAPFAVCNDCGAQVRPANALTCPECGATMREEEERRAREASNAAILSAQIKAKEPRFVRHPITDVTYAKHEKPNRPPSLRVEYWSGPRVVCRDWICLEHPGYAGIKAVKWWERRVAPDVAMPASIDQALEWLDAGYPLARPTAVVVNDTPKYPEAVSYEFDRADHAETGAHGNAHAP